jgi:hydroxymethylpyrimidine pyrophosphatase-like HAD family hydrolase
MEMIKAAGCGIAMGNATPALKEAADYVTSALDRDGIWNALCHFGLIPDARPILHEADPERGNLHLY